MKVSKCLLKTFELEAKIKNFLREKVERQK